MRTWLVDEFGHGGIGRYAVDVANLVGPGFGPVVATSSLGPVPGLEHDSVEWFPRRSDGVVSKAIGGAAGVWRAVRSVTPGDVAWVPLGIRPLFEAALLAALRTRGARVVVTVHNRGPHGRGESRVVLETARRADVVVVHTTALEEWATRNRLRSVRLPFPPPDVRTGEAPTHTRDSLGIGGDRLVVALLGYLYRYKGVDVLLDALARMRDAAAGTPVHVLLAGRVAHDLPVDDEIDKRGLGPSVTCRPGWLEESELADLLGVADVVALPYLEIDNTGMGALALSRGLPAVASDLPALRELFGEAAVYAPPGDADALASALLRLPGDLPRLRAAAGARSRGDLSVAYQSFLREVRSGG